MSAVAKLGWCIFLSLTCCVGASGEGPHHYVFFNQDRERISDAAFLGAKAFEGAQLKYTWRELEQYLKVDYIFWCTQEPFYSQKLIPFLQEQR